MDPITGTALILSLIPLFQRERDKTATANKEEFYQWLIEHKFQDVKDCITNNFQLSTEIEKLLRLNQEELISRFDEVDQKLFCIMNSMSEFRGLVKMVAPKAGLSEQEESILRQFVESEEDTLMNGSHGENGHCWETYSKVEIKVKRQNIIESSLKQLAVLDFLDSCINSKGEIYYQLTEQAYDYVENLKKSDLTEQEDNILRQFVTSGGACLIDSSSLAGGVSWTITRCPGGNHEIKFKDKRTITSSFSRLSEQGFLEQCIGNSGNIYYELTPQGIDYIDNLKKL